MVQDSGRRKFDNAQQVLILQVLGGVQAAAGQQSVLDAGCQYLLIAHLQIQAVQVLQQTVPHIVGQILQMVTVNLVDGAARLFHNLLANVAFLCFTVLLCQRRRNGGMMFLTHLPQIGGFCPAHGTGI